MSSARRIWGVVLAITGCGPSSGFVSLPSEAGAESYVASVQMRDGPALVGAQDAARALIHSGEGPFEIHVAFYGPPLAELGLEAGEVLAQSCRPCSLLSPLAVYRATNVDGSTAPQWTRLDDFSKTWTDRHAAVPIFAALVPDAADRCGCPRLEPEVIQLDAQNGTPKFAVEAAGGALVGLIDGRIFAVGPEGRVEARCRLDGFVPSNGARDPDGAVWVGGFGGQVGRLETISTGTRACALELVAPIPEPEPIQRILAAGRDEVYALLRSGSLWRFDGAAWSLAGRMPRPVQLGDEGGILQLGREHVVAFLSSNHLIEATANTSTVWSVRLDGIDFASSTTTMVGYWEPELGLLITFYNSGVRKPASSNWTEPWTLFGGSPRPYRAGAMLPFLDGFLLTTSPLLLYYDRRTAQYCERSAEGFEIYSPSVSFAPNSILLADVRLKTAEAGDPAQMMILRAVDRCATQ